MSVLGYGGLHTSGRRDRDLAENVFLSQTGEFSCTKACVKALKNPAVFLSFGQVPKECYMKIEYIPTLHFFSQHMLDTPHFFPETENHKDFSILL